MAAIAKEKVSTKLVTSVVNTVAKTAASAVKKHPGAPTKPQKKEATPIVDMLGTAAKMCMNLRRSPTDDMPLYKEGKRHKKDTDEWWYHFMSTPKGRKDLEDTIKKIYLNKKPKDKSEEPLYRAALYHIFRFSTKGYLAKNENHRQKMLKEGKGDYLNISIVHRNEQ